MNKPDIELLQGILDQFDEETVEIAMKEYSEGEVDFCQREIKDFPDPGKELEDGEDGMIPLEDQPINEAIIPAENNLLPVHFLQEGAQVQRAVARVHTGGSLGSGFMVSKSLFLTNNHVIPDKKTASGTKLQFNYQLDYNGRALHVNEFTLDTEVFYTNRALDFTLVRVKPKRSLRPPYSILGSEGILPESMEAAEEFLEFDWNSFRNRYFWVNRYPGQIFGFLKLRINGYSRGQRVSIIQHPRGRRKEAAVHDNKVTIIFGDHLRYTTDTEPGSSGSPVFNIGWELVGLHHAATRSPGGILNNQGIRIDKIIADLRRRYSGGSGSADDEIRRELGI